MTSDILIIGGGAAGLMAAYGAGSALFRAGKTAQVTVLEKMPRPGRKIMITGKALQFYQCQGLERLLPPHPYQSQCPAAGIL